MNQSQPETPRQLIERAKQAAARVNAITNAAMRESAIQLEAKRLGVDPKEFRKLTAHPTYLRSNRKGMR